MADMMRSRSMVKVRPWYYTRVKGSWRARENRSRQRQLSMGAWRDDIEAAEKVRQAVDYMYRYHPPDVAEYLLRSYCLIDLLAEHGLPLTRLQTSSRTPR